MVTARVLAAGGGVVGGEVNGLVVNLLNGCHAVCLGGAAGGVQER